MHRTISVRRPLLGAALFGLALLLGHAAAAHAQEGRPQQVIVPRGGTINLQMSTKKALKDVSVEKPNVIRVARNVNDPSVVLVTGDNPGIVQLSMIDVDGAKEAFEIVVQTDVEYLKYVLRKAVPTANVEPVPSANNAFILTGTVGRAEDVAVVLATAQSIVGDRIINALRVGGVQQIQLDVTIARVNRSEARTLGFSFIINRANYFLNSTVAGPGSAVNSLTTGIAGSSAALAGSPNLIFGVLGDRGSFSGFLNALRAEGLAKLLAEPKLVTVSGRSAEFVSGGDQAVPVLAAGGAGGSVAGVEFRPFGTTVRFLPIVLGNGKIYLEVTPEVTFPDQNPLFATPVPGSNGQVFGRVTQRVQTQVILEDGQTFAIGGLIQRKLDASTTRVPILGDIPFLSPVFSVKSFAENEEELVILVTPHFVDALDCKQLPKYLPGMETRSPDDFELFLEGILEAPRGPREVCPGGRYTPAFRNSATMGQYPCGGNAGCGQNGACGTGACTGGNTGCHYPNNGFAAGMLPEQAQPALMPAHHGERAVPVVTEPRPTPAPAMTIPNSPPVSHNPALVAPPAPGTPQ